MTLPTPNQLDVALSLVVPPKLSARVELPLHRTVSYVRLVTYGDRRVREQAAGWAKISTHRLGRALGCGPHKAARVLSRLVELRVLLCDFDAGGRRASGYTISDRFDLWRVRWAVDRELALRRIDNAGAREARPWLPAPRALEPIVDLPARETRVLRAQADFARDEPGFFAQQDDHSARRSRVLRAQRTPQLREEPGFIAQIPGALLSSTSGSSSSYGATHDDDEEEVALVEKAIGVATGGQWLTGQPRERLRDLVRIHGADPLVRAVSGLQGWRSPVALVDHLAQLPAAGFASPAPMHPTFDRVRELEDRLARLSLVELDQDTLDEIAACQDELVALTGERQ